MKNTFNELLQDSIVRNWDRPALSNFESATYTFGDVADHIARYHLAWADAGLKPGFRVALCGRNSAEWCIGLLAAFTYGAVAVPLLNEFTPDIIVRLVRHSEAQVLLVSEQILKSLASEDLSGIRVCVIEKQELVNDIYARQYPEGLKPEHIAYHTQTPEEMMMINYTSGTTSEPKGVMIPQRALWSNMAFAEQILPWLTPENKVLSMLPTAHLYGMSFELLYEFCVGIHVTLLNRALSPGLILKAMKVVQPDLIIVVPMVIEKIVRKAILPKYNAKGMSLLRRLPLVGSIVKRKFRDGLVEALGGKFYEIIIGGAGLNSEVEAVLHDIKFPYTVGYGMSECAPIICYEDWKSFVPTSCGKAAPRMEIRIDSDDPQNVPGEILTRGMNVMLGYYKNEEATAKAIDADGWLHTGDMGVIDRQGNVFIRGRIKNMLLSPSGQNVYPEEIEAGVNNLPFVVENVVVQREHRLIALVYPDRKAAAEAGYKTDEEIHKLLHHHSKELNAPLPSYAHVNDFELVEQEFEKTPKKSIKRFLYK